MNALIQTPTPSLAKSQDFFEKLQFKKLDTPEGQVYSDGKALVYINEQRTARAGVRLYRKSWESVLSALKHHTPVLTLEGGYVIGDPSGAWIYLLEREADFSSYIEAQPFSLCGNYMGIGFETLDMEKSIAIWEILGFKITMGARDSGFVVLMNDQGFGLSIMRALSCPHIFLSPGLTYFNGGKNLPIIKAIREAGVPILEEITHFNKEGIVDNVILSDPGGLGFFVFND